MRLARCGAIECEYGRVVWKEFLKDDLPFWRSDVATKEGVHGGV